MTRRGEKGLNENQSIVLIIDDDDGILLVLARMVERIGYQVISAGSGHEGLEALRRRDDIGLVILDLTMPGMSGDEVVNEIRSLGSSVPILISSGVSQRELEDRLSDLGVSGTLHKPFRLGDLRSAIDGCFARSY